MKRIILGIILHPFKRLFEMTYRKTENKILADKAAGRNNYKMWDRMHRMSEITNTAFTKSELYKYLSGGLFIEC